MDTIIIHSCGHRQTHALFGLFAADTERQARQLARRRCDACYQDAKRAQDGADAALSDGFEPVMLQGSDKQVSWAEKVRAKRIAILIRAGADAAAIRALAAQTQAKWWIDKRDVSDIDLIAMAAALAS